MVAWEDSPGSGMATCDQEIQNRGTERLQLVGQRVWQDLARSARSRKTSRVWQNGFGLCGGGVREVRSTMASVVRLH